MPNMDSSEYTSRKRLAVLHNANSVANSSKFRAPTRFDTYNPHRIGNKRSSLASGDVCTTQCIVLPDKSDIFAAKKYAASKVPHFNRSSSMTVLVIPANYCSIENIILTAGVTYNVTNNSNATYFFTSGSPTTTFTIPAGQSTFTATTSGRLQCD